MSLSTERCLEAITEHGRALADDVTAGSLRTRVEHCPDWNLGDLVWHLTEVHWLWRTVAGEQLSAPPEEIRRPVRPPEDELVDVYLAGLDALVQTLGAADQDGSCWTWYPPQQDVAFVTRHQVQEAVVHHFDAAHAVGRPFAVARDLAVDSIEEFLTTSLADAADAARVGIELGDALVLQAEDADGDPLSWTVTQDDTGAVVWAPGGEDPTVTGTSAELLLWLYARFPLTATKPNLVNRFRRLAGTG